MTNINTQEYISPHFKLSEFIKSETAIKNKIDNTPNKEALDNLKRLANEYIEPLRALINEPIYINSGYRSKELNKFVNGVINSAHLSGRACDIYVKNTKLKVFFSMIIQACQEGKLKKFDQLIYYPNLNFIHYGIAEASKEARFNYFVKM